MICVSTICNQLILSSMLWMGKGRLGIIGVILSLTIVVSSVLKQAPGFYLTRYVIGTTTSGSLYNVAASGYDFSFSWTDELPDITAVALTLSSFETTVYNAVLSYRAELSSYNVYSGTINFNPVGSNSQINYLAFSVWVTTQLSSSIEIKNVEILSPLYQGASPSFYFSFTANSSKMEFSPTRQVSSACFLQWVTLVSSAISSQKIGISCSSIMNSPSLQVQVSTQDNTNIQSIKITVIIAEPLGVSPNIASFLNVVIGNSSSHNFVNNFGAPTSLFGSPVNDNRCFIGILFINLIISSGTMSILFQESGTDFILFSTLRVDTSQTVMACLAQCPDSTFIGSQSYTCQSCHNYIPNCHNCYNSSYCIECYSNTVIDVYHTACRICSSFMQHCRECDTLTTCLSCYFGEQVIGGCTDVANCVEVEQIMSEDGNIESYCVRCSYGFILQGKICQCDSSIYGDSCLNQKLNCLAPITDLDEGPCYFCNITANFVNKEDSTSCECKDGFQLINGKCSDVCGDGKLFTSECDDQNDEDGDGCSSSCFVESYHKCFNGSQTSPSSCQYIGPALSIVLIDTQKVKGENSGVFTFSIDPPMPLLLKFYYSDYFFFNCSDTLFSIISWNYSGGIVTLRVDYQTDLQGKQVFLNFTFDQIFIEHSPVILKFTVESNGTMLIVEKDSLQVEFCIYFFLSVSVFSVVLVLVGSCIHRMAGVQLLNVLQTIYYLHFTTQHYTPAFSSLQEMSIVGLDCLFLEENSRNILVDESMQKLPFSQHKTQFTLLGIALTLTILIIGMAVLWIIRKCSQIPSPRLYKIGVFLYNSLLPISLAVSLPSFLGIFSLVRNTAEDSLFSSSVQSFLTLLTLTVLSVVFFNQFIKFFSSPSLQKGYIRIHYTSTFQLFLIMQVVLYELYFTKTTYQYWLYAFLGLTLSYFLLLLKRRPYERVSDTLGVLINISISLVFQLFFILRENGVLQISEQSDAFCLMIIAILLVVSTILSVFRLIFSLCVSCREQESSKEIQQNSTPLKTPHEEKMLGSNLTGDLLSQEAHFVSLMTGVRRGTEETKELKMLKKSLIEKYRKNFGNQRRVREEVEK